MRYFWLAITAATLIFLVNTIGFIDTMTDSAMGCGKGFPLCNGHIYPNFHDYHSVIEYTHRMVVGLSSLFLFATAIISWFRYKTKMNKWLVFFAVLGIFGESTLGALTVMIKLSSYLLAAHLGLALISFSALVNIAYVIYQEEKNIKVEGKLPIRFTYFSWFTFVFLYLAIYFGGYVAKTGAGGVFKGFPFPTESYVIFGKFYLIDVVHRLFALGLIILFSVLVYLANKHKDSRKDIYRLSLLGIILIVLQGLSGALLIYTHLSMISVLIHVSIVSLLVGTHSLICFQTTFK